MATVKGKTLISLTAVELLPLYSEIIELYYTGDKIGYRALAKQFGTDPSSVTAAIAKYKPKKGTRDVVLLLQSKINDMWGPEDTQPNETQESSED